MGLKLVALDIDGTILLPNETVPQPAVVGAIRDLNALGVHVVLASGRMFPGTKAMADFLGLHTPLICLQGCGIHRPDGGLLHSFPISLVTALSLVEHAKQAGYPYEWFNPQRYLVSEQIPDALEYARLSGVEAEFMPQPENSGLDPTGVGIISNGRDAPKIHAALTAQHGQDLHILDFPTVTVALSKWANKGHSLSILCKELGIERTEVVAVGDSVNDATMLEWAGRGFAMGASDGYATAAADEVLGSESGALATLLGGLAQIRRNELRL